LEILGLIFLLFHSTSLLLPLPKLMGMLIDCVKKGHPQAKHDLGGFNYNLFLQSIFLFFRLYLFVNFTENTLLIRVALTVSANFHAPFPKTCYELNSRISSDITQIQEYFNINHSRNF
jgi:hypothetical protein